MSRNEHDNVEPDRHRALLDAEQRRSTIRGHCVALILGPVQIGLIAWGINTAGNMPWLAAILVAVAGSLAMMLSLSLLGFRFFSSNGQWRRFSLATIMVSMVPLTLYLAFIRMMIMWLATFVDGLHAWSYAVVCGLILMFMSLLVFLEMANTLIQAMIIVGAKLRPIIRRQ